MTQRILFTWLLKSFCQSRSSPPAGFLKSVIMPLPTIDEQVWNREKAPRLSAEIQRAAQKKLRQLNAADNINDLRIPPGNNRLEKLAGNRAGQQSIRINDHYRICFVWTKQGPLTSRSRTATDN
jgi:toxin HigB-1